MITAHIHKIKCNKLTVASTNKITAKNYIQDGLVAMWDGIENAGWGTHDSSATVWTDLTGNGYDAVQRMPTGWHWSVDSYVGDLQSAYRQGFTVPIGLSSVLKSNINSHTIECVFKAASIRRMVMFGQFNGSNGLNLEVGPSGNFRVYYSSIPDIYFQVFSDLKRHTCITRCNGTNCEVFVDDVLKRATYNPRATAINDASNFILGGELDRPGMSIHGNLYRVTVYSRALTADEIAANYAIDKARFNLP